MGTIEIDAMFFDWNRQRRSTNDFDHRSPSSSCQVNRSILMWSERNSNAKNNVSTMMAPIVAILTESKLLMAVVVVVGVLEMLVFALVFVVRLLAFVLNTHNGISVYHMLDIVIYLTAIGFFANVNKLWKK